MKQKQFFLIQAAVRSSILTTSKNKDWNLYAIMDFVSGISQYVKWFILMQVYLFKIEFSDNDERKQNK